VLTSENRWLWIMQRGQITARSAQGEPVEAAGICIEIDQRKRQENLLRLDESRLATALWGARAAFWQWHIPTDIRTPSPMWFAMTGYTREHWESQSNPWREHIHPRTGRTSSRPSAVTGPMRLIRSSMNIASERPPVSGSGCSIGGAQSNGPRKTNRR